MTGAGKFRKTNPRRAFLFWLVVGAIFTFLAYGYTKREYFGSTYDGEVTGKRESRGRKGGTWRFVAYTYIADGQKNFGEDWVGHDLYDRVLWSDVPGAPGMVKVKAAKVLGIYFNRFFLDEYEPNIDLVLWLWFAAVCCDSMAAVWGARLYLEPGGLWPPDPVPGSDAGDKTASQEPAPEIYEIPRELLQSAPRAVVDRGADRALAGCLFPLLLAAFPGAYFIFIFLRAALHVRPSYVLAILFALPALACNYMWMLLFLHVVDRIVDKYVCRWGRPVRGRIVRTWKRPGPFLTRNYVQYEYDHPGLGRRVEKLRVQFEEYFKAYEGREVTVLCFPHRRWPRRIYECIWSCRVSVRMARLSG